jgi:anoctamin-10
MFLILAMLFARHEFKDDVTLPLIGGIGAWQLIMAIFVEIGNIALTSLAKKLTERENHRTQTDHDTQLLAKVFAFKFVNSYFVLYYVAFFKGRTNFFGEPLHCLRNDCFYDLQAALAMFMIVRLISQSFIRFLGPRIKSMLKNMSEKGRAGLYNMLHATSRLELADMSAAEQQSKRKPYDPFQDFDETLVTHGYATLFSVTAPWCCSATLLWIFLLTKLDVKGLTEYTQRPLPIRTRTNEPWDTAFDIYGILATITNITAIIFASNEFAMWTITEKLMLFIMLIHMVLFAKIVIKTIFPEIPRSVEVLHLKQVGMVHRALEHIKVEPQQDLSTFMQQGGDTYEVLEQDIMDDEELEPELDFKESARTLRDGLRGQLDRGLICIIVATVSVTMLLAAGLFIYNQVK